jgi:hypothetical protein
VLNVPIFFLLPLRSRYRRAASLRYGIRGDYVQQWRLAMRRAAFPVSFLSFSTQCRGEPIRSSATPLASIKHLQITLKGCQCNCRYTRTRCPYPSGIVTPLALDRLGTSTLPGRHQSQSSRATSLVKYVRYRTDGTAGKAHSCMMLANTDMPQ